MSKLLTSAQVLDHGYLKLISAWGSDAGIIEAARMSTAKGFQGWGCAVCTHCGCDAELLQHADTACGANYDSPHVMTGYKAGDEKLLRYLWTNKHATPFEMAGLTIEVKAPIFVFRQWHRHRTQSYNEMSARYTPLPDENYIPTVDRLLANSKVNKQAGTAKGASQLTPEAAELFRANLAESYARAEQLYLQALSSGVPKELARVHLPVARYSRMRASANLRNWLGFLTLRLDPHAQYEVRVYAEVVGQIIKANFPRTWELFAEGLA